MRRQLLSPRKGPTNPAPLPPWAEIIYNGLFARARVVGGRVRGEVTVSRSPPLPPVTERLRDRAGTGRWGGRETTCDVCPDKSRHRNVLRAVPGPDKGFLRPFYSP